MTEPQLNLARKWRAQSFDQIVGQDLSLRMLKNSLYLGHYFPVYLFFGQRGCGKTTTARVFAAAVNCQGLSGFQKDPKSQVLPCLSCTSCKALFSGKHPDFIEIDAASHTGVDNIRQIIDSSALLPIMGSKKIYLIDEAHMLSKAAFNALLKVLEEPPPSALFILATTDPQKIIETVKSRCFQLLFKHIDAPILRSHLEQVCQKEEITYDEPGLDLVIKETQGCARDALNVIEQVRFSTGAVTKESVLKVFGHLDTDRFLHIIELIVKKNARGLITYLNDISFSSFSAEFIWDRFIELTRALLWLKYGVQSDELKSYHDQLNALAKQCSLGQLNMMLETMYANELVFAKTRTQHLFIEMLFLKMCGLQKSSNGSEGNGNSSLPGQSTAPVESEEFDDQDDSDEDEQEEESKPVDVRGGAQAKWDVFISDIEHIDEPIVRSVFQQGQFVGFDAITKKIDVVFSKDMVFFESVLEEQKPAWFPLLKKAFAQEALLNPLFTGEVAAKAPVLRAQTVQRAPDQTISSKATVSHAPAAPVASHSYKVNNYSNKNTFDVSDKEAWKITNLVLQYFPGSVTEMRG